MNKQSPQQPPKMRLDKSRNRSPKEVANLSYLWYKLPLGPTTEQLTMEKVGRDATEAIQGVGELANADLYDYEVDDAKGILRQLQTELDEVKQKFSIRTPTSFHWYICGQPVQSSKTDVSLHEELVK